MNSKTVEMCRWLLGRYAEFKFYELTDKAFEYVTFEIQQKGASVAGCVADMEDEERCLAMARKKWEMEKSDTVQEILRLMEDALPLLEGSRGERYRRVLRESFFTGKSIFRSAKETALLLHMGTSRYYAVRSEAEDVYMDLLMKLAETREFQLEEAYEELKRQYDRHMPGGQYYEDSLVFLRKYRSVKFGSVEEKTKEKEASGYEGTGSDILTRWMHSSMMENTCVELLLGEEVIRRMGMFGEKGKLYAQILTVLFLDEEHRKMNNEKRIKALKMTKRVLYVNRKKAITMFSKILWGTSGYRH